MFRRAWLWVGASFAVVAAWVGSILFSYFYGKKVLSDQIESDTIDRNLEIGKKVAEHEVVIQDRVDTINSADSADKGRAVRAYAREQIDRSKRSRHRR